MFGGFLKNSYGLGVMCLGMQFDNGYAIFRVLFSVYCALSTVYDTRVRYFRNAVWTELWIWYFMKLWSGVLYFGNAIGRYFRNAVS